VYHIRCRYRKDDPYHGDVIVSLSDWAAEWYEYEDSARRYYIRFPGWGITIALNDIDFLEITDEIDTIMCIDRDLMGGNKR